MSALRSQIDALLTLLPVIGSDSRLLHHHCVDLASWQAPDLAGTTLQLYFSHLEDVVIKQTAISSAALLRIYELLSFVVSMCELCYSELI